MEALGAFSDGEWDSFTAMFSSLQELDHSTELQLPNNGGSEWFYSLDAFDPNLQSCSSCSTDNSSGSLFLTNSSTDSFVPIDERNFGSSFFSDVFMEEVDEGLAGAGERLPPPQLVDSGVAGKEPKPMALKRKVSEGKFCDNPKKKSRVSGDAEKKKKGQKRRGESGEEEGNNGEEQSSISYSSEEESGLKEKSRASRGSATDPQSLYARKRRERINERLRILQKLVPNGTKVDISTMLEEAVHYVKFLQLQIKLLSSDELWMFAPLAYNGMDLGLNQKLSPFLSH